VELYDAIIVGAGPAGLTAASYLGRFRRQALVLDGGRPRASWIPTSHNTPGFPSGVGGVELLERLRAQALRYGAQVRKAEAERLSRTSDGFEVSLGADSVAGRFVVMATGVIDKKPPLVGIDEAILRSLVRVCPICDAYEAIDRNIAVLGDGGLGAREALFLADYSRRVTLLCLGDPGDLGQAGALQARGIETLAVTLGDVTLDSRNVVVASSAGGKLRQFDYLYLALGCETESRLAVRWGAEHDDLGTLIVDGHQQTSVDGLYAVGDVVRGLNQMAVAFGEAVIAATDIHNRLRK